LRGKRPAGRKVTNKGGSDTGRYLPVNWGVARAAIDGQLRAIDAILNQPSPAAAAATIARVAVRHENTRVIMAMAQSADQEATLRSLFRELADGIVTRAGGLLEGLGVEATDERRSRPVGRPRSDRSRHCAEGRRTARPARVPRNAGLAAGSERRSPHCQGHRRPARQIEVAFRGTPLCIPALGKERRTR
jgi:hypothetical protein